mmetsp:Transcript_26624/g.48321  ORF Transcript_26624/g.48321 Transcript_26624/m.48321 type:complete len:90 (-) Transcript_26624:90-359(-)
MHNILWPSKTEKKSTLFSFVACLECISSWPKAYHTIHNASTKFEVPTSGGLLCVLYHLQRWIIVCEVEQVEVVPSCLLLRYCKRPPSLP